MPQTLVSSILCVLSVPYCMHELLLLFLAIIRKQQL